MAAWAPRRWQGDAGQGVVGKHQPLLQKWCWDVLRRSHAIEAAIVSQAWSLAQKVDLQSSNSCLKWIGPWLRTEQAFIKTFLACLH